MNMFFRRKKIGPEYYFERGDECLAKGDYPWALESFNNAIEYNSEFEMAYYKRAEAYKGLGRIREAVWDYIKFLQLDHRMPGMAQDAKEAFKEAINIARMDWQRDRAKDEILSFGIPNLLEEIIEGYDPEGEYTDTSFYDLALSLLEASSPRDGYHIGFVRLLKKDFNKAIKEFDKAIKENPENPNAYYFRGIALIKKMKMIEKKGSILRPIKKIKEFSEEVYSNFKQALKRGFKWRICPGCGYRTSSMTNFCMRCGKKLITGK